ncbi:MAG: hypothetical protein L6R39_007164, partial [Caloplaca ligustica]
MRQYNAYSKNVGSVIRVSPNELSFSSYESCKAIYGSSPDRPIFPKSDFYDIFGAGFKCGCIGSERDPVKHTQMKRFLAPAFSNKALSEQEDIVQACIDAFILRLKIAGGTEKRGHGLDMTVWFDMLAFDVLGEMAFGESFHCIEEGKPHFWQQMIANHLYFITVVDNLRSRIASPSGRKDFLSDLVEKTGTGQISMEELTAHASTLV